MPVYDITDSATGVTLELTGDSPPTEDAMNQIFEQHRLTQSEDYSEPPTELTTGQEDFSPIQVNIPEQNSLVAGNVINQYTKDPESRMILDDNLDQRERLIEAASLRFPQEVVDAWKDSPIEASEAFDFLKWSDVLPGGGIVQGVEALNILSISNKLEAGETVTASEQKNYNEFVDKQIEIGVRGFDYLGAGVYYGAPLPAFMVEFAGSGFVTKGVQAATVQAITKGVAKSAIEQTLAKTAGRVARVGAISAVMVPMQAKNFGEQRLGGLTITDKGEALFRGSKDSPAMSALKAYAHVSVEVASELSGATINKYLINPITKKLKTPLINAINKLPPKLLMGLFTAYQKIRPNATISKAFTAGGWNGMLAELGEERVADVLRETVNLTLEEGYTFDQVLSGLTPTPDQLKLEAGLIGAMGGFKVVSNVLANILIDKGLSQKEAQETVDNLTVTEQEAFVGAELELQSALVATELEIATGKIPPDVKDNILETYDRLQEGKIDDIYKEKEKTLEKLGKERTTATRANTPLAKLIAFVNQTTVQTAAGESKDNTKSGINIDSYVMETGAERKDLAAINKQLNYTLFRAKGGMKIDQIIENLPQTEYWGPESSLAKVMDVIEQIAANPKLPAYSERQLNLERIEQEISILEQTKNEELEAYYEDAFNNIQEVETSELAKISLEDLEASLEQKYPMISMEAFDSSMKGLEEYVARQELEQESLKNTLIASQTEAELEAEGVTIDPNESMFDKAYALLFDRFQPLINLSEEAARRGATFADGQSTDFLIRQFYSVAGMATQITSVNTFTIGPDGNVVVTGNGLKKILNDFDNLVMRLEPNKEQRSQDFKDYLEARRIANDLSQHKNIVVTDDQKVKASITRDALAVKYGDGIAFFDKSAQEVYDFQTRVLRLSVDSGILSEEQFDNITKGHKNYIPFQRVLDKEFGEYEDYNDNKLFSGASPGRFIKKMFGSEKEIKDPIGSIIQQTFRIVDMVAQNKVARSMASLSDFVPEYIQPTKPLLEEYEDEDGKLQKRPSIQQPAGSITVFEDGKRKFYKVTPAISKAITQLRPEQRNFIEQYVGAPFRITASILRSGATIIPTFWVKNIARDMHGSLILSEARPIPVVDPIRGLLALMGKTELHAKWMQSGGSLNMYMDMSDNGMARAQEDLLSNDGKIVRYLKNPIRLPEDISLMFEQANRIGVFAAAKRKGWSDTKAAVEARDATLDFARGGSASKAINPYISFFNAGMQGADKLYRAMRDNPKATTMWAAGTITLPSLVLSGYYLFNAPDDEKEEYLEIPQWQKDLFWVFKFNGEWKRYPKPFTLGYVFGSVPERFMKWLSVEHPEDGVKFWSDIALSTVGSMSPVYDPSALIPPLMKVTMENVANYNYFKGRSIYPVWMDDLPPEEQKTRYTSDTAIEIGEALNVSPAKVENAMRGVLAGSSEYITGAGDFLIEEVAKWNGEEIPAEPTSPVDTPVLRTFGMRDPTGSLAESFQLFQESAKTIRQTSNKVDRLRGEERLQYQEDNVVYLNAKKVFNKATKNISKLYKKRNLVYDDLRMTGEEKQIELKFLDDLILDEAKRANSFLNEEIKEYKYIKQFFPANDKK